jgi:uncharacterized membrane protein
MNSITALFDKIDFSKLVPEMDTLLGKLQAVASWALMIGPIVMLAFGLWYYFLPPKEANHKVGFRTWFGMGSVEAWRFTQRLAGVVWSGLGIVLLVMAIIVSLTFGGKDVMQIATSAFICLLWQAGLTVIGGLGISFIVFLRYDTLGYKRKDT